MPVPEEAVECNFLSCKGDGLALPSPGCAQLGSLCPGLQGGADERAAEAAK